MDQQNPNHWRHMFEAKRRDRPPGIDHLTGEAPPPNQAMRLGSYDDGFDPSRHQASGEMHRPPLTADEITDEAAMALALDATEYKPWVLQRGRSRPAMMLHLRRFEPKSGLWMGWQLAYPHLIAVEYTGDKMLSLDFGSRQFVVEGSGLDELARHLQTGSVLMVQEYANGIWPEKRNKSGVDQIRSI